MERKYYDNVQRTISNVLSLRPPQADSLQILADLARTLDLHPDADPVAEIAKVKKNYPTCADFERDFVSLTFALATGVGKTRLMGAFIAYLHMKKGIKNFFVLAPNLTIYNKLITDLSEPTHPKYVFKGIGKFVMTPPVIITGDNYEKASVGGLLKNDDVVHINIFNISKINKKASGTSTPKIKKLSEYIGESYFDYLSGLDDLVVIMDESHQYRAKRGMEVINELRPAIGLELTATPQIEKGAKSIKFKNVVYEYPLSAAMNDGYVKEPFVATRANFEPADFKDRPLELDRIKLLDGIRLHNDTRTKLDLWARQNEQKIVKPFVLVVAKDTHHAAEIKNILEDSSFYNGYYQGKVMEIHSNQKGDEKEENVEQLLTLESPENKIEVVIHVNMLKEGWDVTNLYTIIPLRTSASKTLTEQTLGRGLRLPYGKRVGDTHVDRLTIVHHDKYDAIIDAANKEDSLIKRGNIITIDASANYVPKEVFESYSNVETEIKKEEKRIETIADESDKKTAKVNLGAKKILHEVIMQSGSDTASSAHLRIGEQKAKLLAKAKEKLMSRDQNSLFVEEEIKACALIIDQTVEDHIQNTIDIPRITITPKEGEDDGLSFSDFDLDVKNFTFGPGTNEIITKSLEKSDKQAERLTAKMYRSNEPLTHQIIGAVINADDILYDANKALLFKLANQAIKKISEVNGGDEDATASAVSRKVRDIGDMITEQMRKHKEEPPLELIPTVVENYVPIKKQTFEKIKGEPVYPYTQSFETASEIRSKVFGGFKKSCHPEYKFDSKTEKDFATLLENDSQSGIIKWLRPAPKQFAIYWDKGSKLYEPDFIVETNEAIYMVEPKMKKEMEAADVLAKKKAADLYCKYATEFAIKPWKYLLIPHDAIAPSKDFSFLVKIHGK